MDKGIDYKKLKKKNKTALSITIDTELLKFLREDMEREGVDDMSLSAVFNNLLENFIDFKKSELKKEEENDKV